MWEDGSVNISVPRLHRQSVSRIVLKAEELRILLSDSNSFGGQLVQRYSELKEEHSAIAEEKKRIRKRIDSRRKRGGECRIAEGALAALEPNFFLVRYRLMKIIEVVECYSWHLEWCPDFIPTYDIDHLSPGIWREYERLREVAATWRQRH